MTIDISLLNKFSRLKITAPIHKKDVDTTIDELEELKIALKEKGDMEVEKSK